MQRESRRETIKAGCLWLDGLKCHCIRGIEQGDGSVEGNESPYSIRCCVNLAAQITQPHTHLLPHICLSGISEILSKRAMRQNFLEENLLCRVQKALNKEYFITPQFLTVKHPVCKYSQQFWVRLLSLSLSPSFLPSLRTKQISGNCHRLGNKLCCAPSSVPLSHPPSLTPKVWRLPESSTHIFFEMML